MIGALGLVITLLATQSLAPLNPVPSRAQRAWQEMELNAFVHFGPNTFTDKEWGGGDEDPNLFAPTDLDCRQWARVFKDAGFKGVIITAKHHDGFSLWPTLYSGHSVKATKWKQGKGDVLRELSDACKEVGLKFGVYVSPWDRNHPSYGTEQYNATFAAMLREVLTQYGPIFEVWFDGANGEGPNGKKQVYDWALFHQVVRECQPGAVIFSDAGPGCRWVGNEAGIASETSWSMIPSGRYGPGTPLHAELGEGRLDGDQWTPPECDVSIRPGWFYHADQDDKVRSGSNLLDLYEKSVGRNGLLLLNVPPDRRGRIAEPDIRSLMEFKRLREARYGADSRRASMRSRWITPESVAEPSVEVAVKGSDPIDRVVLGEPIEWGQRVAKFRLEGSLADTWETLATGTTIGRKRILPVRSGRWKRLRLTVLDTRARAAISRFEAFAAPTD